MSSREPTGRVVELRRTRGWLLQLLALAPAGADDGGRTWTNSDQLQRELAAAMVRSTRDDIERELAYLKGRGYVELEKMKGHAASRILGGAQIARLTSSGQDIVDGTTADNGIDLGA